MLFAKWKNKHVEEVLREHSVYVLEEKHQRPVLRIVTLTNTLDALVVAVLNYSLDVSCVKNVDGKNPPTRIREERTKLHVNDLNISRT